MLAPQVYHNLTTAPQRKTYIKFWAWQSSHFYRKNCLDKWVYKPCAMCNSFYLNASADSAPWAVNVMCALWNNLQQRSMYMWCVTVTLHDLCTDISKCQRGQIPAQTKNDIERMTKNSMVQSMFHTRMPLSSLQFAKQCACEYTCTAVFRRRLYTCWWHSKGAQWSFQELLHEKELSGIGTPNSS